MTVGMVGVTEGLVVGVVLGLAVDGMAASMVVPTAVMATIV